MNGASHLIGGVTAAVLLGVHRPSELAVVAVASLLPDIDRDNSLLGRFIPVLPSIIESIFGKRTITHSLLFCGILTVIIHLMVPLFLIPFLIGFLSHLILDLPTGKVALLWPLPMQFTLNPGIPPVFIETASIALWGAWLTLGGYHSFTTIFSGGF